MTTKVANGGGAMKGQGGAKGKDAIATAKQRLHHFIWAIDALARVDDGWLENVDLREAIGTVAREADHAMWELKDALGDE